ncbi:Gmad2 immunoglobulin-like domain-containing protein [Bacillus sp. B15-48]|uniref:Gmad2 immunoglobulin-like domain-containing protein n=1 Tax=Bacillus sp. B15-48 TaxID=1548601 RepID=UPI00193FA151|nr:Gmad2 immunoglobulin-like domain-containing protein [Bacillus sp. B15-48]
MKKILVLLMLIGILASCNQQDENTSGKEPNEANPEIIEEKEENRDDENSADSIESEGNANDQDEIVYENEAFKEVIVNESEKEIIITGKTQVFEGVFQYAVYEGDEVLLENYYQTDGGPAWGEFEITLEKELIVGENRRLELFVYSAKDGSKINTLQIDSFPIKNE